jgi:hypothetical protein
MIILDGSSSILATSSTLSPQEEYKKMKSKMLDVDDDELFT